MYLKQLLTVCLAWVLFGCVSADGALRAGRTIPSAALLFEHRADFDRPPVPIHRRVPVFPINIATSGASARITMSFAIDTKGRTGDFETVDLLVKRRSGFGTAREATFVAALERHVVAAMQEWTFEPAIQNGEPTPVRAKITWRYGNPLHSGTISTAISVDVEELSFAPMGTAGDHGLNAQKRR